jgi:hypothetical protein
MNLPSTLRRHSFFGHRDVLEPRALAHQCHFPYEDLIR